MENEDEKLKQQAEKSELFTILVDSLKDEKDIPKTEKGLTTKAKELMEKLDKKLAKLSEEEKEVLRNKRRNAANAEE